MLELLLDLTRRALEGFVFAAPCVGIWFLGLRFHKKAPPFAHMLAAFGLCLYLSGVLAVTGIGKPFGFFPRISLVPFVDMIKGPVDTTLNVRCLCRWACFCRCCILRSGRVGVLPAGRFVSRLPSS